MGQLGLVILAVVVAMASEIFIDESVQSQDAVIIENITCGIFGFGDDTFFTKDGYLEAIDSNQRTRLVCVLMVPNDEGIFVVYDFSENPTNTEVPCFFNSIVTSDWIQKIHEDGNAVLHCYFNP